jgi:hypothetical protein
MHTHTISAKASLAHVPAVVPSLQDLCSNVIMQHIAHRSDTSVLEVYSFAKLLGLRLLFDFSLRIVRDRFTFYLAQCGPARLRELLADDFDAMHKTYEDRIKAEAFLARRVSYAIRDVYIYYTSCCR